MPKKVENISKDVATKISRPKKDVVVENTPKEIEVEISTPNATTSISKKEKELVTKKNILQEFDNIIDMLNTEIQNSRENSSKTNNNVKFLRLLNKNIKSLQSQCVRVMKQKNTVVRENNNSGFQKPVKISNELAKFAGWSENELRSRVDVTKYICDYIASNKLQNPEDKRQIIPDSKLQKLLGFNPEKADKPLYYYGIQTYLKNQNHFPKD